LKQVLNLGRGDDTVSPHQIGLPAYINQHCLLTSLGTVISRSLSHEAFISIERFNIYPTYVRVYKPGFHLRDKSFSIRPEVVVIQFILANGAYTLYMTSSSLEKRKIKLAPNAQSKVVEQLTMPLHSLSWTKLHLSNSHLLFALMIME